MKKAILSLLISSFLLPNFTYANPLHKYCPDFFLEVKTLQQKVAELDAPGKEVYEKYQALTAAQKRSALISADEAAELSAENDIAIYRDHFKKMLEKIQENPNESAKKLVEDYGKNLLTEMHFTEAEIAERIVNWKNKGEDRWYRLFGDRTLKEVQKLYIGNEVGAIAVDSLIGKYISETGAKTKKIRYPTKPGSTTLGQEKILIAVSANSLEQFKKILEQPYSMSVLGHAHVLHRGNIITHGAAKSEFRLPSVNTPLPFLMMKTSESERLNRYMNVVVERQNESWYGTTKQPWKLQGYCAQGGYDCCTHWLGNIPLGDLRVDEYKFPGNFENNQGPQIQKLATYTSDDEKIKQIWKVPGHQQFSAVIGQENANLQGQFASPGWVITTLLTKTENERVPVVFWITNDHTVDIPDDFQFRFEAPR